MYTTILQSKQLLFLSPNMYLVDQLCTVGPLPSTTCLHHHHAEARFSRMLSMSSVVFSLERRWTGEAHERGLFPHVGGA